MHLLNMLFLSGLGFGEIFILLILPIIILPIVALWRLFEKAGEPGWQALIPIYNLAIIMKIGGKPGWWALLACIPYIGLIWSIWGINMMVKSFGKSEGYTIGIIFLPYIFLPMLAFSNSTTYSKPASLA